jgi:hypothetical protein
MKGNAMNREQWLTDLMHKLSPLLEAHQKGATACMDTWRVSVGWPGGRGSKNRAIGQCWPDTASKDGRTEMFISPALDDPMQAAETLLHEMVHASVGVKFKHGPVFGKLARAVGLSGKLTATVAGPELVQRLHAILNSLPEYPHASLNAGAETSGPKKQTTRMLKAQCPECGYTVRLTAIWVAVGLPSCPCGECMVLDGSK